MGQIGDFKQRLLLTGNANYEYKELGTPGFDNGVYFVTGFLHVLR